MYSIDYANYLFTKKYSTRINDFFEKKKKSLLQKRYIALNLNDYILLKTKYLFKKYFVTI